MRKTAITTLLSMCVPENKVCEFSGHSAGSKEFYRYFQFSEQLVDLLPISIQKLPKMRSIFIQFTWFLKMG